jgi:hypothetical protein
MTDLINLNAESGRNIISDDSTPTLELENSSSGQSLSLKGALTDQPILNLINRNTSGSATIAVAKFACSTASAPAIEFAGSCIQSTASGSATLAAAIRIKFGDVYGFIPVLTDRA